MLPKINRLPKQELRVVVARGARAEGDGFTLRYRKASATTRVAVVASSKIDKRATQRNRIRRIIYESVQNLLLRITPSDLVFIVRKNISTQQQKAVEKTIETALKQKRLT